MWVRAGQLRKPPNSTNPKIKTIEKQAGAELCQAQVKLYDIVLVAVKVVVKQYLKFKFYHYSGWVVGWLRFASIVLLIST